MNGQFRFGDITPVKYFLGIGLVLVCLFTFIGEDSNILMSFFRWFVQVLIPLLLIIGLHFLLSKNDLFKRLNPWLQLTLSGVLGAFVFSPIALQFDVMTQLESLENRFYFSALLEEFSNLVAPVTIAWVAMNSPWILGYRLIKDTDTQALKIKNESVSADRVSDFTTEKNQNSKIKDDTAVTQEMPSFFQLLPEEMRAPLLYLKSELHYLSVHTEKGKALILYNLKDAVQELDRDLGVQPHRSYWVARAAIKVLQKKGREGVLHLINGKQIPVSRNKLAMVKAETLNNENSKA